jgi:hypothetical protein
LPRRSEKNAVSRDGKETAERACGSSLLQSVAERGAAKLVLIWNGDLATRARRGRQSVPPRRRRKHAFRRRAFARATRKMT